MQAVTTFSLLPDDFKHGIYQFGALRVMSLSPIVSCPTLTEDKVVRAEQGAERTGAKGVHGSGLEVDEDGARNILVGCSSNQYSANVQ